MEEALLLISSSDKRDRSLPQSHFPEMTSRFGRVKDGFKSSRHVCCCLKRPSQLGDTDVSMAERVVLSEASRIYPGRAQLAVLPGPVCYIHDENGASFPLYQRLLVDYSSPPQPKQPPLQAWGVKQPPPESPKPVSLILGEYASSETMAWESLRNMTQAMQRSVATKAIRAGDLEEFEKDICSACGKHRERPKT